MITSTSNEKIKKVKGLQSKIKLRTKYNQFVVEGIKMIKEAPKHLVRELYATEKAYGDHGEFLDQFNIPVTIVSENVSKYISNAVNPHEVLCILEQLSFNQEDIIIDDKSLIVALEDIQDPGNLGTIIRTLEAAHVDGVVLSKGTVDVFNPKVIRATMGSIFRLKIARNVDLFGYVKALKSNNVKVYATDIRSAKYHFEVDMRKASCLLIGNEGHGLSKEVLDLSDENIIIPILGEAESLNAALATGIVVYEALRQRMM